jgi:CheY-like chemotaxis protein
VTSPFARPDASREPAPLLHVLLVEDNPWHQELIRRALLGPEDGSDAPRHEVLPCGSLEVALMAAASESFDVVLLDLDLPDAEGTRAIATLRAAAPRLPIVVLTGTSDEATALAALREGAQDYLVKGTVDAPLLRRSIRYAIERKAAEEAVARSRWLAGIGETVLAMQHEINNPLSVLLANAELLAQLGEGHDQREMVDAIVDSAWRIAAVVRELAELKAPQSVAYLPGRPMLDLSRSRGRG